MDPEVFAPMFVMVTGIVTAGGVLILRPIAKHLGEYLRTLNEQSKLGSGSHEAAQIRDTLSMIESRLALLEERQNFTENLLTTRREAPSLPQPERKRPTV